MANDVGFDQQAFDESPFDNSSDPNTTTFIIGVGYIRMRSMEQEYVLPMDDERVL